MITILHLGYTPLRYSAENGNVDVVKYLVDHGADDSIQDRFGEYRAYQN